LQQLPRATRISARGRAPLSRQQRHKLTPLAPPALKMRQRLL
jgi:hypothetical protein